MSYKKILLHNSKYQWGKLPYLLADVSGVLDDYDGVVNLELNHLQATLLERHQVELFVINKVHDQLGVLVIWGGILLDNQEVLRRGLSRIGLLELLDGLLELLA
jgi:hypothetical protein